MWPRCFLAPLRRHPLTATLRDEPLARLCRLGKASWEHSFRVLPFALTRDNPWNCQVKPQNQPSLCPAYESFGPVHRIWESWNFFNRQFFFLFSTKLYEAFVLIGLTCYLLSQVEVNVSRDPSRLYKLTAGWEQRKKDGPGASGSGPTLHMPHRYVHHQ